MTKKRKIVAATISNVKKRRRKDAISKLNRIDAGIPTTMSRMRKMTEDQ